MNKGKLTFLLVLFLFLGNIAYAGESVYEMAQSDQYGRKAGGMLGRGLVNVATCFVDLIVQTVNGTQSGPPFVGTLTGLGSGLGCSALRVTSGALDVLTFWVPDFNGIPVGRSYANCLEDVPGASASEASSGGYAAAPAQSAAAAAPSAVVTEEPAPSQPKQHDPMDYVKK